ncbi:DUF2381 family protein [Hyalangium gracile]|uniref:DUF2381 family protein n=1 Tax=Hyalangium gracile TaxID=394092 RepID=UPI001CC92244|nr:DUF2381 family protein [Hyalangium gracile]
MRLVVPCRFILLGLLVASAASAKDREFRVRNVILPNGPDQRARPIYVAGEVATVLRFETDVDPRRTKLEGWEGRFEPPGVAGRVVVLVPLYDLTSEDRIPLVVTMVDGTQWPFTVTADNASVDHQVNLLRDRDHDRYMRASLAEARVMERIYREKFEKLEQEDTIDHALASLLAKGAIKMTPFRERKSWLLKDEGEGTEIQVFVYTSRSRDKAAVVLSVRNGNPEPWSLLEARLRTSKEERRPFAMRTSGAFLHEGTRGRVAFVIDGHAFDAAGGPERLVLEIFRQDGLKEAIVELDPSLLR